MIIELGTDMLMKHGAKPLLKQGLISVEQYNEMSRRNATLSQDLRNNKIIIP